MTDTPPPAPNPMQDLLRHPWVRVLLVATSIAMASMALRETASITGPVFAALSDVLVPVAVGFALAYIVLPVVDLLGRWGISRTVGAGLIFGLGSLALAGTLALVVPVVVKQVTELSVSLVQGESYVDRDGNGRYDPGEPFTDSNLDGQRNGPLLGRWAAWLEDSQAQLRVGVGLGLNDQALAAIDAYAKDTTPLREALRSHVTAARDGQPRIAWPAAPPGVADQPGEGWNPDWPWFTASLAVEAAATAPEADRAAWWARLRGLGMALHQRHAAWVAGWRVAREGRSDRATAESQAILAAWKAPLGPDVRQRAIALAVELERQARSGGHAARALLAEAGANLDGDQGLTNLVDDLERAVRGIADDLPGKAAAWAKSSISSWDRIMLWLLNLILIPVYAFFLLLGMPRIRAFVKSYLPSSRKTEIVRITKEIEKAVAAFFRGRLLICVLCALFGCVLFLGLSAFHIRVPYGVLFGLGIGVATAIPLSGIGLLLPALALTFIQPGATWVDISAVIVVYTLIQGLEAVLLPVVMGREVELHPVTLIIALLLCGKLLGILGLILAVPIAASLRILLREWFWPRLRRWSESGRWEAPAAGDPG